MQNSKAMRKPWMFAGFVPVLVCIIPLVFIFIAAFSVSGKELKESFLFFSTDSVTNTLWICIGVLLLSLFVGVGSAYLFSHYTFPGSRFFQIAFLLPLAIPAYILAVTYASFFDYGGLFYQYTGTYFNMMNMVGLIFVLAVCLYPYVYITALNSFKLNSGNYIETAKMLGVKGRRMFVRVLLPLALPAIVAGLWLIVMETLNDFGAASYYGVRTISTEIIRCWQIGPSVTIMLSLVVLVFTVLSMIVVQKYLSKKQYTQHTKSKPIEKKKLKGAYAFLWTTVCSIWFLLVFVLPVGALMYYTLQTSNAEATRILFIRAYNSFIIAAIAAVIVLFFAVLSGYGRVVNVSKTGKWSAFLADFGYAIPGAALAVALISASTFFDGNMSTGLTGSLFFLIVAYCIRFYAVARQPIQSVYDKIPASYYQASLSLGNSPLKTFFKVYFPMLYPAFITIFLMVFIDVLKELPLTLILRPFNFETLSTSVYGYAKVNESVQQAAPYSLLIITLGVIALLLFKQVEKKYGSFKT